MKVADETKTHKTSAYTWAPLDTVTMRGNIMNIFEHKINRILHGLDYVTPTSMVLLEGKHRTLTSKFEMEDPSSGPRIGL